MTRRPVGEAIITIGLAVILLAALALRDDFPAADAPSLPPFLIEVDGASIGSEVNDQGVFWTIDSAAAEITVTNTGNATATASVSFRVLDGPCATGQSVSVSTLDDEFTVGIPAGESAVVAVDDLEIAPFTAGVVGIRPREEPCGPLANDPRSIAIQLFEVAATAE